ncbi:MAG: prephenate dehydrogenase [Bacillales bacterium]|nr:prephenate dehydrogenase [Bacillales bacterium]
MNKDSKILIVGLGLIGGSIALKLSQKGYNVSALDINKGAINYAHEHHIINNHNLDDTELIKQADLIILCLYPSTIISWIKDHQSLMKDNVIITDVTGIKTNIVNNIQSILTKDKEFIAMHPMCGKETSGVEYADCEMFKIANLIIVPTEKNKPSTIEFIKDFGKILEFNNIEILSVEEHDKMISFLSQLPHAIAVSLMNCRDNDHLTRYTGDSFRDLTRIAKINASLWSDLFIKNKENLVSDINSFIETLNDLKDKINNEDKEGLEELFIESKRRRQNFDKK